MEKHRVQVRTQPRPPLPASQRRAVDEFWRRRQEEIEATVDFTERILPMARLKKVIRAEEDGMMISADTPAFLAKLCELFVQELAVRAWSCAESHNRRIILDLDIAEAVASTESYDFLVNVLLTYLAAQGGCTSSTPPARLITSKRHRPDPDLRRPVHAAQFGRYPPHVPITPPPAPTSVNYMPFAFPCVLQEAAPPSVATVATPMVHGLTPPINHVTRGFVFFRNDYDGNDFACNNYVYSAAAVVTPPSAEPAGALLPNIPAAYYCPFPVANNVEPFAVGDADPTVIPPKFADGNIVNSGGKADANGDDGQRESVVMQKSCDVQDGAAVGAAGGIGNGSSMDMFLEEILMEKDLLFPDADLFPLVSTPPDLEDFVVDQNVIDGIFSNPSTSTSTSTSSY